MFLANLLQRLCHYTNPDKMSFDWIGLMKETDEMYRNPLSRGGKIKRLDKRIRLKKKEVCFF